MFKLKKKSRIRGMLIALGLSAAMVAPVQAAPRWIPVPAVKAETGQNPILVDRRDRRGFYRKNGRHYYNGHRGFRKHRRGYRKHNGWWFPPAAFALGTILGAQSRPPERGQWAPRGRGFSREHYRWCSDRYRSYDPRSNTFQPYHGPRRPCRSPYY